MQDYDRSHVKSADILRPATPQQLLVSVAIVLPVPRSRLFLSNIRRNMCTVTYTRFTEGFRVMPSALVTSLSDSLGNDIPFSYSVPFPLITKMSARDVCTIIARGQREQRRNFWLSAYSLKDGSHVSLVSVLFLRAPRLRACVPCPHDGSADTIQAQMHTYAFIFPTPFPPTRRGFRTPFRVLASALLLNPLPCGLSCFLNDSQFLSQPPKSSPTTIKRNCTLILWHSYSRNTYWLAYTPNHLILNHSRRCSHVERLKAFQNGR